MLNHKISCDFRHPPLAYDLWYQTPIPNVVAFTSNNKKVLRCPSGSTKIYDLAGYIELEPGCYVSTDNHLIKPSADRTSTTYKIFKFEYDEEEFNMTVSPTLNNMTLPELSPLNDTTSETELESIDTSMSLEAPNLYLIVTAAVSITIAVCVTVIIFVIIKLPRGVQLNEMEMKDFPTTGPASPPPSPTLQSPTLQ
jgi:hypothetical protein